MTRVGALFLYKLRFFFGPALRGTFGPLAYIGLILLFLPSGYGIGITLAAGIKGASAAQAISTLSAPLSAVLALGLLYSVFSGVTAHVSEFDFFMTADVRPREYLLSDLLFQFVSLFGAGGLAAVVAAFGMVSFVGRPLLAAVPLLVTLFAFALLVLMVIQIVTVLNVRYPKGHVRAAALVLFVLSLLPAATLAYPAFPLHFQDLPLPMTAFGTLGYDALMGVPVSLEAAAVAAVSFLAVAGAWVALSDTYIFHGIHPSLSAGFGQIDMAARMAQQRRMTAGFGKFTTGLTVRTDRGNDTSYMARYHLLRIVRDGSIVFIGLFAVISLLPIQLGNTEPSTQQAPISLLATQMLTFLVAILALNWSYYERDNLWIVVAAAKSPAPYFRGLMMSFTGVGLVVAFAFVAFYLGTYAGPIPVSELAVPIAAAVSAALVATACLTRLKVQPAAFSFSMLAILASAVIAGYFGGFVASGILSAVELALGLGPIVQVLVLAAYCAALAAFGLWWVSRLAAGFRL